MSKKSEIEWTDSTWNPITGCVKVGPGCKYCYALVFAERFRGVPGHYFEHGFDLQVRPGKLDEPRRWKSPRVIFVNSMSDLFYEDVPVDYIKKVFEVMRDTPRHTYQVLTKRSERMAEVCRTIDIPDNVWMGVSVENADYLWRVDDLRRVQAKRFLSCEPLLGPLDGLNLTGIDWVIGGGESGSHLVKHQDRRLDRHPEWIRGLRDICEEAGVEFHFKQWGGHQKAKAGRVLDGQTYDAVPGRVSLRVVQDTPVVRPALVNVVHRGSQPRSDRRQAAYKAWNTMRASVAKAASVPQPTSDEAVLSRSLQDLMESAIEVLFRNEITAPTVRYGTPGKKHVGGNYRDGVIIIRHGQPARSTLAILAHELCHHACPNDGHGQKWQKLMIEIGLRPAGTPGKFSQTEIAGGMFERWADSL